MGSFWGLAVSESAFQCPKRLQQKLALVEVVC